MTCVAITISDHALQRAAERLRLTPAEVRAEAPKVWSSPAMPRATAMLTRYVASLTRRGNTVRMRGRQVWVFFETANGPYLVTVAVLPRPAWLEHLRQLAEAGKDAS